MLDETRRRLQLLDKIIYDATTERPFMGYDDEGPTQAGKDAAKVLEGGVVYVRDPFKKP